MPSSSVRIIVQDRGQVVAPAVDNGCRFRDVAQIHGEPQGEIGAAMNPTAIAVMLGVATGAISLFVFSIVGGHPLLLASMVALFIAMFVRWG